MHSIILKRQLERRYFDLWYALYNEAPKGKIQQTESPDFIIHLNRKTAVGIEITRLVNEDIFGLNDPESETVFKGNEFNMNYLQDLIAKKDEKYSLYQSKKFKALWLLIVLDEKSFGEKFHFPMSILNLNFESRFDKLFLLHPLKNRLFELK
jgi:hypothetical protein